MIKYERIEDAKKMVEEMDGVRLVEDEDNQKGGLISVKLIQRRERRERGDRGTKEEESEDDEERDYP